MDTIGLLLIVVVHTANTGQLVDWVNSVFGWILEIAKRSDDIKGFQVLPHRWVVERTFGWLSRYQRLSKDYEGLTE